MTTLSWVLAVWGALGCVAWIVSSVLSVRTVWRMHRFEDAAPAVPAQWPRLSAIVPACQEAHTLERALATLRAQDYPDLQIVLVDDRSTDGTGALVDRLAAEDPRIEAVHVETLPAGWLGKVHALHVGAARARGEWLLFTDADVHHSPGFLRKAVAVATERRLDHLSALPELRASSFLQEAVIYGFGMLFLMSVRPAAVADPKSDACAGVGAFNLVRRSAYDRSAGLEWLRMEIGDDVGLGLAIKRAGGRAELWLAQRELSVQWYPSLRELVRGLEKNMFAVVGHFRWSLTVARMLLLLAVLGGPLAAALSGTPVAYGALAALACLPLMGLALGRRMHGRAAAAALLPLGQLLLCFVVLRSAWHCWRRGGVVWRGTFYPLAELRAQQRVRV